jgi:S-adenosylmethionine synthetase
VAATQLLADLTSARSILLIYISTDYIFPGSQGDAPYEVNATPSPPNLYGLTKLDGEKAVLEVTKATGLGVVLRVPVLYGSAEEPKESAVNVLMDSVWKASKSKDAAASVSMDHWALRYPTNTEDVARVLKDVAELYLATDADLKALPKILQFSSEDRLTKYEICEMFADIMGLPIEGMKIVTDGGVVKPGETLRPYDCHLSTKALKDLGVDVDTQDFKAWW